MSLVRQMDWVLFGATLPLLFAGLITMYSFVGENYFFERQVLWIAISLGVFFALSTVDYRFLRRGGVLVVFYLAALLSLVLLAIFGELVRGSQSWFNLGIFSIQPADFMKILLIIILAKYFSRRHIEIAHVRHILVSGLYALIPFLLILIQPDFGSAVIIFFIWLGMIMISGVSKRHLFLVMLLATVTFGFLWGFGFTENQRARIVSFLNPLADIRGAGYNAFQSTVAVGSGEILGRGVGFGTQSRLSFLPEYETDFIFAAFAEEWGFIGVMIVLSLYGVILWRILANAFVGDTNLETLFGIGLSIFFVSHIAINIGMNVGLLPVTGLTLPFMSYGGSHLLSEFIGLGILMGMRRHARSTHRSLLTREFVGL